MSTDQPLADMPFWLLVLLSLAGLSGEMLRASGSDLTMPQVLKRIGLRFMASTFLGMGTLLLVHWKWGDLLLSAGLGIVIAVIGADVAGGLYTQLLAKRAGLQLPAGRVDADQ